jgi:hypothetical protein
MNRITRIAVAFGLIVAMSGALAGTAAAQDPSITVNPPAVPTEGSYEVTIEGADYPGAALPVLVLLCSVPGSGDAADVSAASCDASNPFAFTIGELTDGGFSATFTFDVPAEGLGIYATEAAEGGAAATAIIAIDPDAVLATTGVESGLLAIIGLAVVAGGAMVVGTTRRRA